MNAAAPVDRRRIAGFACGICVALIFSSFILVSRLGYASPLKLIDVAALRFLIAGTLMWPVLLHYGFDGVRPRDVVALALFGGLGFALLTFAGFALAPASHGGVLLHGTLPLFSSLFAWGLTRRPPGGMRQLGLLAILAGITAMACESLTVALTH